MDFIALRGGNLNFALGGSWPPCCKAWIIPWMLYLWYPTTK